MEGVGDHQQCAYVHVYGWHFQNNIHNYRILSSIVHTFLHEKRCWNIPWILYMEGTEKGFKMACMMKKLAMINFCEIILEIQNYFFWQKFLWNSGAHYTCMHIILDKIW